MSSPPRRPGIAALLAAVCNGLGHLYAAGPRPALAVFALWLALGVGVTAALRAGPVAFAAALLAAFVFWLGQAVHAAETARRRALEPRGRSSHPLALLGFLAGTTLLANVLLPPFRARMAHTVYAPSGSMIPTVQVGDVVAVAAGVPSALRGAVVELAPPAGPRSGDTIVKRVVAGGSRAATSSGRSSPPGTSGWRATTATTPPTAGCSGRSPSARSAESSAG